MAAGFPLGDPAAASCGNEPHRERIHAMARVFFRDAFAAENVAEVRAAGVALDLGPPTVRIDQFPYGSGNGIVKSRPAALRVELVRRAVEFRAAAFADVGACFEELIVFTAARRFGSLVLDDPFFLVGESVVFHGRILFLSMMLINEKAADDCSSAASP